MSELSKTLFNNFEQLMRQNHRMMGFMSMNRGGKHFSSQQRVLGILKKHNGEMTTSQLAEELDIRPSSVSELIKKLEKSGFVTRKKDEKDKRVTLIHLTVSGVTASEEKSDKIGDFSEIFFNSLAEEEQAELNRLLEKLLTNSKDQREEWFEQMQQVRRRADFGGRGRGRRPEHPFSDFEGQPDEMNRDDFFHHPSAFKNEEERNEFMAKFFGGKYQ